MTRERLPLFAQGAGLYAAALPRSGAAVSSSRPRCCSSSGRTRARSTGTSRDEGLVTRLGLGLRPGDRGGRPRPRACRGGRDRRDVLAPAARVAPADHCRSCSSTACSCDACRAPTTSPASGGPPCSRSSRRCRSPSPLSPSSPPERGSASSTDARSVRARSAGARRGRGCRAPAWLALRHDDLAGTTFTTARLGALWCAAVLALLGALTYWWPKLFGRLLDAAADDALGRSSPSARRCFWSSAGRSQGEQGRRAIPGSRSTTPRRRGWWLRSARSGLVVGLGCSRLRSSRAPTGAGRERPVAGGHARVVHDLAAAAGQLRHAAARRERATARRPPSLAEGEECALTPSHPGRSSGSWRRGGALATGGGRRSARRSSSARRTGARRSSRCPSSSPSSSRR